MNKREAQQITKQIRCAVKDLDQLIITAYAERAWAALGYPSWADYCQTEFESDCIKLHGDARVKVAVRLKDSGMSNRAIAVSLGIGKDTVARDLATIGANAPMPNRVTTSDGRSYPATRPKPSAPEPVSDSYEVLNREAEQRDMIRELESLSQAAMVLAQTVSESGPFGLNEWVEALERCSSNFTDAQIAIINCTVRQDQ
jgi:hypothetical protein